MRSFHRNVLVVLILLAIFIFPMPAFSASSTIGVTIDETLTDYDALTRNNLVFMPARDLAKIFDATLDYNSGSRELTLTSDKKTAVFQIGFSTMTLNGRLTLLDAAPMVLNDSCYLPIKAINIIWGASYGFNEQMLYIHRDGSDVTVPVIEKYQVNSASVSIDNKTSTIRYVAIPKDSGMTPGVVVAENTIGSTESLDSIAKRSSAKVAINGGLYQSYAADNAKEPFGILIKNGTLIHSEPTGSAVGFAADGTVKMDIVQANIIASVGSNSYPIAYMNHTPSGSSGCVVLFTTAYGNTLDLSNGTGVVVQNGEIIDISSAKEVTIPANGFILQFIGDKADVPGSFKAGMKASYRISYTNTDWSEIQTAVGAGPLLVKNGNVVVNPEKEGFLNATDFSVAINRSAVGVKKDGTILLVAGVKCTLSQMADVMISLGAEQAICMDSGQASGLYALHGEVPASSKEVSNALIFK